MVITNHEIPAEAAREALRLGREGGAWTILNPAPAGGLDRSVLGLADVLTPNRGELALLVADDARRSGRATLGAEETIRAARTMLETTSEGPGAGEAMLVSLGPSGAVLVRRGGPAIDIKAPRVKAIDATGAGDALNGALAAALAGGLSLEQAARRAVVAASISVTRAGAREGYPTLDELTAALGETPAARAAAASAGDPSTGNATDSDPGRLTPAALRRGSGVHVRRDAPPPAGPRSAHAGLGHPRRCTGAPPGSSPGVRASSTHQAARPRVRASSPIRSRPARNSDLLQTSDQAGSGAATVTAISPVRAGSPVRGSTMWCARCPSGATQFRTLTEDVATEPRSTARTASGSPSGAGQDGILDPDPPATRRAACRRT